MGLALLSGVLLIGCSGGSGPRVADPISALPYVKKVAGDHQTASGGQRYAARSSIQLAKDAMQVSSWNGSQVTFTAPSTGPGGQFMDEGLQMVSISSDKTMA